MGLRPHTKSYKRSRKDRRCPKCGKQLHPQLRRCKSCHKALR